MQPFFFAIVIFANKEYSYHFAVPFFFLYISDGHILATNCVSGCMIWYFWATIFCYLGYGAFHHLATLVTAQDAFYRGVCETMYNSYNRALEDFMPDANFPLFIR